MTRRDCLKGLALMAAPRLAIASENKTCNLENADIAFELIIRNGKIVSRRLTNKHVNEVFDLPLEDFALEFDKGIAFHSSALRLDGATENKEHLVLKYSSPAEALEVRVEYSLLRGKCYLRKQIAVKHSQARRLRIMRADLDNWKDVSREWKSMRADRLPYGSHPIFCETLWAGVEFVAAFNEYSRKGFILRSRPGGKPVGPEWFNLHSTVVGVAEPGKVRESFLNYIEDIRLGRPRLVTCYNTWWSLPPIFKHGEYMDLIREMKRKLYDQHGVFFDLVTTDMGWSDPRSIWRVNLKNLPDGLADMVASVTSAGGKPGVWMSPSEVYPPVIDYKWAEENGYGGVSREQAGHARRGLSLANPKYLHDAKRQLQRLIEENRLGQMKFDGFLASESHAHDQLLPGDDSVEPLAEHSLELIKASKEANPEIVTEPTYMNSLANYISPWIIKYADVVWGNAGGDCPCGLGPAPDYREAQTTAREYYIFSSLHEVWLPQNALQYFDIVNCDNARGFANHAAMAFGRGRFYVPTYVNPKFMSDEDWRIYAGLIRWARKNQGILRNTRITTSRVELGEPYAYAHWDGNRGLIAVRNPSNESQKYVLNLLDVGAPKSLAGGICYTQYPYRKGIAAGLASSGSVSLDLAPWELLFLEIIPRQHLREVVALGARWYREPGGGMRVSPAESEEARILLPHHGERTVRTKPPLARQIHGKVLSWSQKDVSRSDWLSPKKIPIPTDAFELEGRVSIPSGHGKGKLLFLVEFAGREHYPSTCSCDVNGEAVNLEMRSSKGHIGSYASTAHSPWSEVLKYESEWTWYMGEIGTGESRIRLTGKAPTGHSRMALYVWTEGDVKSLSTLVDISCSEAEMPQYRDHLERQGRRLVFPLLPALQRG
ncbi:MAG TPA: hypothetical protein VMW54_12820 [Terriglobia bacterium]|nr:hypothetical protein [Terriglobia bacterium]